MRYSKVIWYIGIFLGLIGIASMVIGSVVSNVDFGVIFPGISGIILLLVSVLKLTILRDRKLVQNKILKNTLKLLIALFLISFIVVEGLIICLSKSQDDKNVQYLIILGAAVHGQTISLSLQERLDKGIDYLNKYKDTKVIVSGGKGNGEDIAEADAMRMYLVKNGIDTNRILEEAQSVSTATNFKYSKMLLEKQGFDMNKEIMIVTNDFHMLRAKMIAKKIGFKAYGLSCNTPDIVKINCYLREYFAFMKTLVFDIIL
jgi:uncharacterized SAM-binding protein YcdF (DUF218 family)